MYHTEVRYDRIVHVLPEQWLVIQSIEGDAVWSGRISGAMLEIAATRWAHNFNKSNWDFLGIISSMCGASKGYVSTTLVRMPRCTEDLTFDFAPAVILRRSCQPHAFRGEFLRSALFFEHVKGFHSIWRRTSMQR